MPRFAWRACPLGVGIRRGYRAGEARALPAVRGTGGARQGAGGLRDERGWAALGWYQGEAAAGRDGGAHAGATWASRAGTATSQPVDAPPQGVQGSAFLGPGVTPLVSST
jgi:hypothetical protein